MKNAEVLVTSYAFPPYSDTAGIVAAKRVFERNEPVDVICKALDGMRHRDATLSQFVDHLVSNFAAIKGFPSFSGWLSISDYVNTGYKIAQLWQKKQGPYRRVYSRAHFIASHFLAARVKMSTPNIFWTAEFSDPLSKDVNYETRATPMKPSALTWLLREYIQDEGFSVPDSDNSYEWAEYISYALADEFLFTNDQQRDFMLSQIPEKLSDRVMARSIISPHPTLPKKFYEIERSSVDLPANKANIGYFGNFYKTRDITAVMSAINLLPKNVKDKVLLHIYTSKPEEVLEDVIALGVREAVTVNPYVNYLEFLNICNRMDVLLINDALTGDRLNHFLPSKWSDYKGSDTPVWAIVEEGSPLDNIDHFAYRSPNEHLSSIQSVLMRIVMDKFKDIKISS